MIAALYVDPKGIYSTFSGVECWGLPERDARDYAGPWPVVAHPPCARWSVARQRRDGKNDDGGTFAATVVAVQRWGGVLEHPALSRAWRVFQLPEPTFGFWTQCLWVPGWATAVNQGTYGHPCLKRTWLYYCGDVPPPKLDWRVFLATFVNSGRGDSQLPGPLRFWRERTPEPFAELLVKMAEGARAEKAKVQSA